MRFILDMASGEYLTDEPGNVFDKAEKTPLSEPTRTLQAPRASLAMVETECTSSGTVPLAGLDLEALIQAIKD